MKKLRLDHELPISTLICNKSELTFQTHQIVNYQRITSMCSNSNYYKVNKKYL